MADPQLRAVLRRLVLPIFLPNTLYAAGSAAVGPVIPLLGLRLGLSPAQVALLTTVAGVLMVAGPVLVGRLVARVGERAGLALGAGVAICSAACCLTIASAPAASLSRQVPYVLAVVALAVADLTWDLGRQTYLADTVPARFRARAMTLYGGTIRAGRVVGPAVGAATILVWDLRAAFVVHLLAAAVSLVTVLTCVPPGTASSGAGTGPVPSRAGVLRPMLLVAVAVIILVVCRTNRDLLLPLLGHTYGHPAALVSLVFAVGAGAEISLMLVAGPVMDRYGRAAVLVPCLLLCAAALLMSPLAASRSGFITMALVFAVGNGLGSGINKTLSADLTPAHHRAHWIGLWNSVVGSGRLLGPGIVTAVAALGVAAAGQVTGTLALAGAVWAGYWVPRLVPGPGRREAAGRVSR